MTQVTRVYIRKLRHWKQRFDKNASFVFRRALTYGGTRYVPGDDIPESLEKNKTKIRRFWESQVIELALFDSPNVATGKVVVLPPDADVLPMGVTVDKGAGAWFIVRVDGEDGDGTKVNGRRALEALLDTLRRASDSEQEAPGGDSDDTSDTSDGPIVIPVDVDAEEPPDKSQQEPEDDWLR